MPFQWALQIGLQVGSVKMALRQRLETVGSPYTNANQLMEHVRHIQLAEESNGYELLINSINKIFFSSIN